MEEINSKELKIKYLEVIKNMIELMKIYVSRPTATQVVLSRSSLLPTTPQPKHDFIKIIKDEIQKRHKILFYLSELKNLVSPEALEILGDVPDDVIPIILNHLFNDQRRITPQLVLHEWYNYNYKKKLLGDDILDIDIFFKHSRTVPYK